MYEFIVDTFADTGGVNAADLAPFIGHENWIDADTYVSPFKLESVNLDSNMVVIRVSKLGRWRMSAHELAVRILCA